MKAKAYCDGGGNSGYEGSCAAVLNLEDGTVHERAIKLGDVTNNIAEYQGAILAINLALENGVSDLSLHSDSQLIVNQILGKYRVKEEALLPYRDTAIRLSREFESFQIRWIRREENKRADKLCRQALTPFARPRPAFPVKPNPFRPQ